MSLPKIYIDGQAGTTALRISQYLSERKDIEILRLPDHLRKVESARQDAIQEANLAILCLPDEAAVQAANWASEFSTRVIDASTAHRVSEGWVYGLPEIGPQARASIKQAQFVANPGCYPTSVILLLQPLIAQTVMSSSCPLAIHALSGYSGGGRRLIERWEQNVAGLKSLPYSAPYALDRRHKHIPEMMKYSGLKCEPQFLPRVGPFSQGMRVEIPLHSSWFEQAGHALGRDVHSVLHERYQKEPFINVMSSSWNGAAELRFDPQACNGTNRVDLHVIQHSSGHVLLVGILDNLGKGAGGAAVQSLNLMLGFRENTGL